MKKILLSNLVFIGCYGGVENSIRFLIKEYLLLGWKVFVLFGYNYNSEQGKKFNRIENSEEVVFYRFKYKPFKNDFLNLLFLPIVPFEILYSLFLIKKESVAHCITRNQFVCFFVNLFFSAKNTYLAPGFSSYQSSTKYLGKKGLISRLKKAIHSFFDIKSITQSKHLAVFSKNMIDQAVTILDAKKINFETENIKLLKPGVDSGVFFPVDNSQKQIIRDKLHLPFDKKLILCIGRFVSAKGFDIAISSMEHNYDPNTVLVIVGDGHLFDEYSQIIKSKNLQSNVILAGSSKNPSLYYQACDYFFMSSIYEPLGQTILEAISSGLPVIAFDKSLVLTATDELLDDQIFVCLKSKSPSSIGKQLSTLPVSSSHHYLKASRSAIEIAANFSWSKLANRLID